MKNEVQFMPNWTAFLKQQLGAKYIEPGQQNPGRKAINKTHENHPQNAVSRKTKNE